MTFHSTYFEMFYFYLSTQNSFTYVLSHFCFSSKSEDFRLLMGGSVVELPC